MNFVAGLLISGLMAILPVAFAFDLSHPPTELTGWLVFIISLCGVLGLIQLGMNKFILKPAIVEEMKAMPSRSEFDIHVKEDKEFHGAVDDFMDEVRDKLQIERRHRARRRGDPQ